MRRLMFIIVFVMISVTGCSDMFQTVEQEQKIKQEASLKYQAKFNKRVELFNSCMELAIRMPRQSDDDVADIVEQCNYVSYYQSTIFSLGL